MFSSNKSVLATLIAATFAAGCAAPNQQALDLRKTVSGAIAEANDPNFSASRRIPSTTYGLKQYSAPEELPGGLVEKADTTSGRGNISITASGRVSSILNGITGNRYSVSFVSGVDPNKEVSANVKNMSLEAAVRQVALNAGYVAVTDHVTRSITIADQAAWTFRIPFRLLQTLDTDYSVGGNPISRSGSGGSGSGSNSGGSPSLSGVKAEFTATGKHTGGSSLAGFIKSMAGDNASVSLSADTGYITVRGNGAALSRVRSFLNTFAYDNNRRTDIKMSVIEVSLGDNLSWGIDWAKVLSPLNGSARFSVGGNTSLVANPSMSVNFTSASITSVIDALKAYTDVRVITQPSVTAMNRSPVVIFDGASVPYLGSITSTATQTATSTAGSASFATSGVSLSVLPDILSDNEAQITLLPVLTDVTELKSFSLGGSGTITAPASVAKHALMQTIVPNGQTAILGGIRYAKEDGSDRAVPLLDVPVGGSRTKGAREVVILMQSTVVPPRRSETLVSESL